MADKEKYNQSIAKVFDILTLGQNGAKHVKNFEEYDSGGINTLVDAKLLKKMPENARIVLSYEVYQTLNLLQKHTTKKDNEHKFLLSGKVSEGTIVFDDVYANVGDNQHSAGFRGQSADVASAFIERAENNNADNNVIICMRHTHRNKAKYQHNFSLKDMVAYYDTRETNASFKSRKMELISCVLIEGNYNFVFYDENANDFFKFTNVQYITKYGQLKSLPAYTEKGQINFLKRYFERDD